MLSHSLYHLGEPVVNCFVLAVETGRLFQLSSVNYWLRFIAELLSSTRVSDWLMVVRDESETSLWEVSVFDWTFKIMDVNYDVSQSIILWNVMCQKALFFFLEGFFIMSLSLDFALQNWALERSIVELAVTKM